MKADKIKNIIFDLGGVIINLDVSLTFKSLAALAGMTVDHVTSLINETDIFDEYEKGNINSADFRQNIKELITGDVPDGSLDIAWNSMLMDIPVERLRFIERLRKNYKIFVLSNTNEIHIDQFDIIIEKTYGKNAYFDLFDKVYYSYLMNKRKPEPEIFQQVLEENELIASETIFFEDTLHNIEAAAKLDLQTFHVETNKLNLKFIENELL